jgi:hypothetical protein
LEVLDVKALARAFQSLSRAFNASINAFSLFASASSSSRAVPHIQIFKAEFGLHNLAKNLFTYPVESLLLIRLDYGMMMM